jgi:hypothetical protein
MHQADSTGKSAAPHQQYYKPNGIFMIAGFVNLTSLRLNRHSMVRVGGGCVITLVPAYTLQSLQHLTATAGGGTK